MLTVVLEQIVGVIFGPSDGIPRDLSWRLMLGSTVLMPTIVCIQVFFCPESPRCECLARWKSLRATEQC